LVGGCFLCSLLLLGAGGRSLRVNSALLFGCAVALDVIRLCTYYRKDEEVYMYRARLPPETARAMFLTYLAYPNRLKDHPEWYNELTRNGTTTITKQLASDVN
jgi:uncharacterized protein DUF4105